MVSRRPPGRTWTFTQSIHVVLPAAQPRKQGHILIRAGPHWRLATGCPHLPPSPFPMSKIKFAVLAGDVVINEDPGNAYAHAMRSYLLRVSGQSYDAGLLEQEPLDSLLEAILIIASLRLNQQRHLLIAQRLFSQKSQIKHPQTVKL